MPGTSSVSATGNRDIDGLLSGIKWATTTLSFGFPTSSASYGYNANGELNSFGALSAAAQTVVRSILVSFESVANLDFSELTGSSAGSADFRYADTDAVTTAWAYYPSSGEWGGDVWVHKSGGYGTLYDNPVKGNYAYTTFLHETGHALGLKHGHETDGYGALPASHDSMEYSVMTYRSYPGALTTGGYTNETWGYAQTLMQDDIAALQHMYGANFNYNSGNTTYSWSDSTGQLSINGVGQGAPGGNRIFMTVWDGGGIDTFDFSNYTTNLSVNLDPGAWTTASSAQRAHLGSGVYAVGNIANALLYQGSTASLIENATGGTGADTIAGNSAANTLRGGGGGDMLDGRDGNDTLDGGLGDDYMRGGAGADALNGGGGSDTASYETSLSVSWGPGFASVNPQPNGVLVDLHTNQHSFGHATGDVLTSIENLLGSAFNDFLLGDLGANIIDGGGGNDFLFGRFGADVMRGGAGNDVLFGDDASGYPEGTPGIDYGADQLFGDAGNDDLYGEGGADMISGGADTDLLNYSTSPLGVSVDLVQRQGFGPEGSYACGDTYALDTATGRSDIENVRGSNYDDIIIGNIGANVLEGMGGNDLLIGSVGADVLAGGAGRDSFAISSISERGDIIVDFDTAAGEIIDLRTLFEAHGISTADPFGDGVLKIEGLDGGTTHTTISIDLDGAAGQQYQLTTLYTLVNVDPGTLIPDQHVIWV